MLTRDDVLSLITEKVHHPASVRELMQVLRVARDERVAFRRMLHRLVAEGALVEVRGHRYGVPDKMDLVVGRLQAHPSGYGFVIPERPIRKDAPDIYVAPINLFEALHGDRVVARVERHRPDGRLEGRVIRILERARALVVGRFDEDENGFLNVVPFDNRLLVEIRVPPGEEGGASPGQMVTVEITRWPTRSRGAVGRIVEVLGKIGEPGVDTLIVIRKHGLPDAHSAEAVEEARRIAGGKEPAAVSVAPASLEGRTDFRHLPIVTIDGESARDFDDAVSVERLDGGRFRLGVHIADVAYYVHQGSILDEEAHERGTSVYFPERAIHMFPEVVATGLCSLNPRVDRLVQSVVMDVDSRGKVVASSFHDGIVKTAERMTYTDVNAILVEGDEEARRRYAELVPMFEAMRDLYEVLADCRRRLGSIDFDLEQPEIVLDEAGQVEAILASERNVAHRIIEEFMLLANQAVAAYLNSQSVPALYRVHEEPDPLKVEQFEEFVSKFGYSLAAPPDGVRPKHFQRLLRRLEGRPEEKAIAFLMLRTMQKARYAEENLGHFGLAFENYTHFTSPIRRYPDLVVHRMLRERRRGEISRDRRADLEEELPEIARQTSERERRAEEAEREIVQWKKVQFMAGKVGDEFEGFITAVVAFGLFVQLVEHFVEGLVHVSTMADDYYRFSEDTHSLRGENTGNVYRLGDRVRVQVLRADLDRRQIDLGLVGILGRVREERERRGKGRREKGLREKVTARSEAARSRSATRAARSEAAWKKREKRKEEKKPREVRKRGSRKAPAPKSRATGPRQAAPGGWRGRTRRR